MDQQSKIIVGVTQRVDCITDRGEFRDALDQRVVQWLSQSGCLAVAVPNVLVDEEGSNVNQLEHWLHAVRPSAFLLSGGNDIGEYPKRDMTEHYLLSWAMQHELPVLGICRGMQMMAVWSGVDLVKVEGHAGARHQLEISIHKSEWPVCVNSFHNLRISTCPDGFDVLAKAEDGTIEAIKHSELPWEGWMWHPEREMPFSDLDSKRLKSLFS